jgi:hypothetical protein
MGRTIVYLAATAKGSPLPVRDISTVNKHAQRHSEALLNTSASKCPQRLSSLWKVVYTFLFTSNAVSEL